MECPVCLKLMDTLTFFGTEIDACRLCGGIWLDAGELGGYIKKGKMPSRLLSDYCVDDSRKVVAEGERVCPRCSNLLSVINHKGVNVDFCYNCKGMWFDRGEIKIILKNYQSELSGRKKRIQYGQTKESAPIDEGEEIIRLDEDDLFEYFREDEETNKFAKSSQQKDNGIGDAIEQELMSGGTKEKIVKVASKSIKKKIFSSLSEPLPTELSRAGTFFEEDDSPFFVSPKMKQRHSISFGSTHHKRGSFVMEALTSFVQSFFGGAL